MFQRHYLLLFTESAISKKGPILASYGGIVRVVWLLENMRPNPPQFNINIVSAYLCRLFRRPRQFY